MSASVRCQTCHSSRILCSCSHSRPGPARHALPCAILPRHLVGLPICLNHYCCNILLFLIEGVQRQTAKLSYFYLFLFIFSCGTVWLLSIFSSSMVYSLIFSCASSSFWSELSVSTGTVSMTMPMLLKSVLSMAWMRSGGGSGRGWFRRSPGGMFGGGGNRGLEPDQLCLLGGLLVVTLHLRHKVAFQGRQHV